MAQELEDGEFWLPSDFLTDDDLLNDFKTDPSRTTKGVGHSRIWSGSSVGWNSDLSSPVDSVMGSAETESDEDEFVAGLTRKLAHSNMFSDDKSQGFKLSSSPQSTLWASKQGLPPSSVSRVPSPPPPLPPETGDAAVWDFPYSPADEGGRTRSVRDTTPFYSTNPFAASDSVPLKNPGPNPTHSQAHLTYLRLQALQQLKQQQLMLMTMKRGAASAQGKPEHHFPNLRNRGEGVTIAAWPTLQQSQQKQKPPGSGMRAVFLGEPGPNKERAGTGVFLPQRTGANPAETRKKPAYSTVLLPDRVIHALNLDLDAINAQTRFRGGNIQWKQNQGDGFSQDPIH